MMDAYCEEEVKEGDTRVVLKLHPALAPIKVAVLPLKKNNEDIKATAHKIKNILMGSGFRTVYDDTAGIGKLYRRQDEVGTPFCVTVDFDTLENNTVTVRDRDTMAQERVAIDELKDYIAKRIGTC